MGQIPAQNGTGRGESLMARIITIAGVDRTGDIKLSGSYINQVLTSSEDSMDFVIKSGSEPTAGEEIIFTESGVKLFAGIIDAVKADERTGITIWNCAARDYTFQFNQKLVSDVWENKSASTIAKEIIARYCTDFTFTGVDDGAPSVEYMFFKYEKPAECMKKLAEYVGWEWYINYDRDVQFFNPANRNEPAPTQLVDGEDIRNWKHNIDVQDLVNQVYVLGGSQLSDPATFEFKADGVQTTFNLAHKPHSISMTVGGISKTIGIENINEDNGSYDYMMSYEEKYVRCGVSTSAPTAGATVAFTYRYDIPVIVLKTDPDSQAAVAAVQGGDGIYEYMMSDDSLVTQEAALAAADAYLRERSNPKVTGSFSTQKKGWAPGQILTINSVSRGISGTFTVQKVKISTIGTDLLYSIEYGGRVKGLEDTLKAIVSAQQTKKGQDTEIITKIKNNLESIAVSDSTTTTKRTPPYICGDADAICGFVVAAATQLELIQDGLVVAYLPFLQTPGGQVLTDYSTNGRNGQLGSSSGVDSSDPSWVDGLSFGGDDYAVSPALPASNGNYTLMLVSKYTGTSEQHHVGLPSLQSFSENTIMCFGPSGPYSVVSVAENAWNYVGAIGNGVDTKALLYKDGSLSFGSGSALASIGAGPLYLGRYYRGGVNLTGNIAAVMYYNRALSDAEIKNNFDYIISQFS